MTATGNGFQRFMIRLARCTACNRWVRVLPLELLPYKTYGIAVIQTAIHKYVNAAGSYRSVTAGIVINNGPALVHSSLYWWITGLAERVLDRSPSSQKGRLPGCSAVIAQTERLFPERQPRDRFLNAVVLVAPGKYRSERRRDQLEAMQRLLIVAALLFGATCESLQKWNGLLLSSFFVAVWTFSCPCCGTSLQQTHPP